MAAQTTPDSVRQEHRGPLLERVLLRHGDLLRRDAVRHTRCPADADAAFSEACFRFLSHFGGEDDAEHALRWLRLAVRHSAYRRFRSERREVPHGVIVAERGWATLTDLSDAAAHELLELIDALAALKADQRAALVLFAAGYSYREIAELRGWTYTKVNRCIAEGRAALRRMQGGEK